MSVDAAQRLTTNRHRARRGSLLRQVGAVAETEGQRIVRRLRQREAPHSEAYITNQYLVRSQITYTVPLLFFGNPLWFPLGSTGFSLGMLLGFRSGPIRALLGFPSSGRILALSQPL